MTMTLPFPPTPHARARRAPPSTPREALRAFVLQTIHPADRERLDRDGLEDHTALFADGLLDSGAVLELVLLVEELCGRPVEAADIGRGALTSIDSMLQAFFPGDVPGVVLPFGANVGLVARAEPAAHRDQESDDRHHRDNGHDSHDACVHDLGGGRVALTGEAAGFLEDLDAALLSLALHVGAERVRLSPLMDVESLARVGYFRSFPQLAVLAGPVAGGPEAARQVGEGGDTVTIAAGCAWTPAACYPLYAWLSGRSFDVGKGAALFTVHAPCARWEGTAALRRQACFDMREIVAVGPRLAVEAEMEVFCRSLSGLALELGLEGAWTPAEDPFFEPEAAERALQVAEGLKEELVVDGVAIASRNFHRGRFVRAFGIGEPTWQSACGAAGLERWLGAVIARHGHDPGRWPCPRAAMARVLAAGVRHG